jgi:hypothetical protein
MLDMHEDDAEGTVFRDVIMLALMGFVVIVVLLLPHLNPPVKASEDTSPPGNLIVEVRWPDDQDTDVDLWVEAPGDRPVGYSNKGGAVFNLLRDDLGFQGDPTNLNYEVAFSRGFVAGEYTVNLHLYQDRSRRLPVDVTVSVGVKRKPQDPVERIDVRNVTMRNVGQEATVVRFALDQDGRLVQGSKHELPQRLREARYPR